MFEHRSQRLLSRRAFLRRQSNHFLAAMGLVAAGLFVGAVGFHFTEGQAWLDSVYSATMLLTAMGLSDKPETQCGKIFAILYSIFAAMVFLSAASILIAPAVHRFFHRLHLENKPAKDDDK